MKTTAKNRYDTLAADNVKMLEAILKEMKGRQNNESPDWGDVGDMACYNERIKETYEKILHLGEYA